MRIFSGWDDRERVCRGLVIAGVMGLTGSGVSAQVPVYANQTNGGLISDGFSPTFEFWDDLQLTQGGTLTSLSIVALKSFSASNPHQASGRIDLTFFDESNNVPQGVSIGSIFFNGTFDPLPSDPSKTLFRFEGLESTPFVLPGVGRLGIGIEFDTDEWSITGFGPPIIGSSPGGNWLGSLTTERSDAGGDFGWKVLVTGTTTQAAWTQGSGSWDNGYFWDIDRAPDATQDVLLRGYDLFGATATITGPGSNSIVKDLTIGELGFLPVDLQLQPGVALIATGSTQVGSGDTLTINGGTLLTQGLNIQAGQLVFDSGTVQVNAGTFTPSAGDYVLSGTGGPILILDNTGLNIVGAGPSTSLVVGDDNSDTATLIARNGAQITVDFLTVGLFDQSAGLLNAKGTGTVINADTQLILGQNSGAIGLLLVEDAAEVNAVTLRVGAGGSGQAVVDGGTLNVTGDTTTFGELDIGGETPGSLTIRNGGTANAPQVNIGATIFDPAASVLVTGPGSSLNGRVSVGDRSMGVLRVELGASVTGNFLIGNTGDTLGPNEVSTIEIDGVGTTVQTGFVEIRDLAHLTVSGGASVTTNALTGRGGDIHIHGLGTTIDTSASLALFASVNIDEGSTLLVEDQAHILSKGLIVGDRSGEGVVQVRGAGTHWASTDVFMIIGNANNGTLEVSGGASFSRTGDVFVVGNDGPVGVIDLFDPGTQMTVMGGLFLSGGRSNGQTFDFTSIGTVHVRNGAALAVDGTIEPFTNGTVFLQSGASIRATTIDLTSGGNLEFQGGVLSVDTLVGDLTQDGGTLAPGASPGTTNITNDFVMNTGTFAVEIGGLTAGAGFDQLLVGNAVTINMGTALDVSLINSFTPTPGDSFPVLNAGGTLTGVFDSVLFPAIPGIGLSVLYDTTAVTVRAGIAGDLNADGFVGIADLNFVLSAWNQNVDAGVWLQGDSTGDGFIGIADLNTVLGNWNVGTPPGAGQNIPEPGTAVVLGVLGVCSIRRRMRQVATNRTKTSLFLLTM
jgi:T5SS/PEP-CTERM-associated repeat protein